MPRAARTPHAPVAATPMAYARVIASAYQRAGRNPAEALRAAQITPSKLQAADARITSLQMEALSGTAMRELDDEGLGAFSRALPWGSYGLLARASLTAPDLRVALKRWCRHHGLLTADIALRVLQQDDAAAIVVDELVGLPSRSAGTQEPGREFAREFALVHVLRNIHGLACWFVDSRIPLRAAYFPFGAPPHAEAYRVMFPGTVHFDAPQAALEFDARYLALPLRRDEKAMRQMLQRALPLTVLQYRRDRLLVAQVRQALAASAEEAHGAESIADLLHMSTRTLHRQLKEEGASLQQLKDEVRCDRAKELLLRTARPVKQVAAAAGFRNEKSFIRAFRQWTGTSPAQFRAQRP